VTRGEEQGEEEPNSANCGERCFPMGIDGGDTWVVKKEKGKERVSGLKVFVTA